MKLFLSLRLFVDSLYNTLRITITIIYIATITIFSIRSIADFPPFSWRVLYSCIVSFHEIFLVIFRKLV